MTQLLIENLAASIGGKRILSDIGFAAASGKLIGLVGPNGAGKSTLVRALARLLPVDTGRIRLNDADLSALSSREAARNVAYLAQSDRVHWPVSARFAVSLGRAPHAGPLSKMTATDLEAIDRAMERTDTARFADRDVTRLSGGERARVLLARALAVEAPLLMVDEPVASLDPRHALNIMSLLREEVKRGTLVIVVLHDLVLASRFCDRLIALNEGALVADGTPLEVLGPKAIERHYAVSAHYGEQDSERFVVPWRTVSAEQS